MPKISFLVSVAGSQLHLPCMLWCLKAQWERDIEVIVTDSSRDPEVNFWNRKQVENLNDPRFRCLQVGLHNCYLCHTEGAKHAAGDYLCFASDDDYYVPNFAGIMLQTAFQDPQADLVYCDVLYDPRWSRGHVRANECQECTLVPDTWVHYAVKPNIGEISKGGFLLRRTLFAQLGGRFPGDAAGIGSDGFLVYEAKRQGALMRRAPGTLWVHN